MERLTDDLQARCIATARVDDDLVVLASAGSATRTSSTTTLVGQRLPFLPPTGSVFAAWMSEPEIEKWLLESPSPQMRDSYRKSLTAVRERGFSIGLRGEAQREFASALERLAAQSDTSPDVDLRALVPDVRFDPPDITEDVQSAIRLISVPVRGASGAVTFGLTIYEFPRPDNGIQEYIDSLLGAARRAEDILNAPTP
jgi:DNA-binding IclR family transcriptional regulator